MNRGPASQRPSPTSNAATESRAFTTTSSPVLSPCLPACLPACLPPLGLAWSRASDAIIPRHALESSLNAIITSRELSLSIATGLRGYHLFFFFFFFFPSPYISPFHPLMVALLHAHVLSPTPTYSSCLPSPSLPSLSVSPITSPASKKTSPPPVRLFRTGSFSPLPSPCYDHAADKPALKSFLFLPGLPAVRYMHAAAASSFAQ
ncbi:hypothetical protein JOL62DRAFT_354475 [Phyllosticta paracitricarpa]|uniref:Uncharacterized protein n=1 Tax=Phyllosticta paracitricarpa TaxID=2016321 RepID=A0ABR1NIN7_9PEZI